MVIGNRTQGNRLIYEYTCCTVIRDADAGPNCGDYDEGYWIIDIVSRLLIPVVALSAAFSFAHYVRNRNARARELLDRRQHRHSSGTGPSGPNNTGLPIAVAQGVPCFDSTVVVGSAASATDVPVAMPVEGAAQEDAPVARVESVTEMTTIGEVVRGRRVVSPGGHRV